MTFAAEILYDWVRVDHEMFKGWVNTAGSVVIKGDAGDGIFERFVEQNAKNSQEFL